MSDVKISQLPTGAAISGTELVPMVQSGSTRTTTPAAMKGWYDQYYAPLAGYNSLSANVGQLSYAVAGLCLQNANALRSLDKTQISRAFTVGYYTPGDGGGGMYYYDPSDVSSTDNGGTVFVASDGGRWKLIPPQDIYPEMFGAVADGITAVDAQIAAAISYVASLSGNQYQDSMGQSPYGYGVSRRLCLSGKKYIVNNTVTLSGDVGVYAQGGGFRAGNLFPAGSYIVDTGSDPYGGRVIDMTTDGGNLNVKGVLIRNANFTRWRGLSVVDCKDDGITYQSGAEFYLSDFEVSGSVSPNSVGVAGLRVLGSDACFSNGVIKFTPIGVRGNGGGNCEFSNIHTWGLYSGYKQYIGFYFTNHVRNTITSCYADSPSKQDYSQDNLVTLNGIPNGGMGFYFDGTSTQNALVGCRGYINTTKWSAYATANGITGNHFWDVYTAGQYTSVLGLTHNYAGNWAGDVRYASNAVRDTCTVWSSPAAPSGGNVAAMNLVKTATGAGLYQTINNDDTSGNAASAAFSQWVVGPNTILQWGGIYGTSGASSAYAVVLGSTRLQWNSKQALFSNSGAAEGDLSYQFSDGVGSYPPMTLHRTGGASSPNAVNASAKFGMTLVTGRSIAAAGTINASGADYAEYETKRDDCGVISPGDIVGFDVDGLLTDQFDLALSFGVKSTDPSYVGGDTWFNEAPPAKPSDDATDDERDEYDRAVTEFQKRLEVARQKVDRIAYSGKVPINVVGARPGQWVDAARGPNGEIVGVISNTRGDNSVGQVRNMLADGRCVVKVI